MYGNIHNIPADCKSKPIYQVEMKLIRWDDDDDDDEGYKWWVNTNYDGIC